MIIVIVLVIILSVGIYLLVSKKPTSLSKPTATKPSATPAAKLPEVAKILGGMWKALTPEQQASFKPAVATA